MVDEKQGTRNPFFRPILLVDSKIYFSHEALSLQASFLITEIQL